MVKRLHWFHLVCISLTLSFAGLHAKDLTAYRTGDMADETITTPFALEVVDTEATAARRAEEALKTPAIFRSYPNPTNAMIREFNAVFEKGRTSFYNALINQFGEITNADELIASPDFTKYVAAFNRKKPAFPVSLELARLWAQGDSGRKIQAQLADLLVARTPRPIRPDDSTNSLPLGENVRLVIVDSPKEYLNLSDAEQRGKIVTLTSVTTVSRLRDLFRRDFAREDQPMGIAVARLIRPNCELDASLTQQARNRDVSQIMVMRHYNPGQTIIQAGEVIDATDKAALLQLAQLNDKKLAAELSAQLAAQRELLQSQQGQLQREQAAGIRNPWLLAGLAGIVLVVLAGGLWIVVRSRRDSSRLPVRAEKMLPSHQDAVTAGLAPQITQVLKEAVVQGLAAQRSELLQAQKVAAAEISELVHRLDELKAPMQERLNFYQSRIAELERELADQSKENRELLKAKIEMLREKIESERGGRVNFN